MRGIAFFLPLLGIAKCWIASLVISSLSHHVTLIEVFYSPKYGILRGLIFFNGPNEIARIGYTATGQNVTSTMIVLAQGE